jgi:hypothetical protein
VRDRDERRPAITQSSKADMSKRKDAPHATAPAEHAVTKAAPAHGKLRRHCQSTPRALSDHRMGRAAAKATQPHCTAGARPR